MLRTGLQISKRSQPTRRSVAWLSTNPSAKPIPWFVSERPQRELPPHLQLGKGPEAEKAPDVTVSMPEIAPPSEAPPYLLQLQSHLLTSPFLDNTKLLITKPPEMKLGPARSFTAPRGRRNRGGSDHGEGVGEPVGGLWDWYMMVQVKEGTEGRGAIEYLAKNTRQWLKENHPHLPIPPKSKAKNVSDGWYLLDVGDTAIHIVSKTAREKWFGYLYRDGPPEDDAQEPKLPYRRRQFF